MEARVGGLALATSVVISAVMFVNPENLTA